jgi:methylated-DNA-[protein]-cysteine S-methyltransferase
MAVEVVRYAAAGWGVGELWLEEGMPVWHELPRPKSPYPHPGWGADPPPSRSTVPEKDASPCDGSGPKVEELVHLLTAYFAGERVSFADVAIDLGWCTPFQRAVAETLREVRYGETVTYGELAALAGHPNAQRAAGTFCAHNRLPLILPCHRVVASGGIGSYGSLGVEYKQRLLELEDASP